MPIVLILELGAISPSARTREQYRGVILADDRDQVEFCHREGRANFGGQLLHAIALITPAHGPEIARKA
jgi:hypothetical protein